LSKALERKFHLEVEEVEKVERELFLENFFDLFDIAVKTSSILFSVHVCPICPWFSGSLSSCCQKSPRAIL
jgi:hypothetical protein